LIIDAGTLTGDKMQFTTRTSEQDFVAANRLASKSVYQTVAFAFIYVLFSLLLLIHLSAVMDKHPGANNAFAAEDIERGTVIEKAILVPGALCFGFLLMFKVVAPLKIRRLYRSDMSQRGENVVEVGPEGVSAKSSAGWSSSCAWSVCSNWRESKEVFVLITQSGGYFTFSKACLTTEQQNELRGILVAALPKK
jgi:hypothetical protein